MYVLVDVINFISNGSVFENFIFLLEFLFLILLLVEVRVVNFFIFYKYIVLFKFVDVIILTFLVYVRYLI